MTRSFSSTRPRWPRRWRAAVAAALAGVMAAWASAVAFAANTVPAVQYGSGGSVAQTVSTALENVAATIRDVLGATALVALVGAALVNHFVWDQKAKDRSKEIVVAAFIGLLIAAFAPQIITWVASL
jgi:hypothetical protein